MRYVRDQRMLEMGEMPSASEVAGTAVEYCGIEFHGPTCTHLDALCHVWGEHGMWNGRDPVKEVGSGGASWGGIEVWSTGLITRGLFFDVPAFRGVPFVEYDRPVHGSELQAIADDRGITLEPGDAVVVYSGRAAWDQANVAWGAEVTNEGQLRRAGLHASCLDFLKDNDCAVLAWDMQDFMPNEWGLPWTVHGAIYSFGMALVDNCELEPLADACRREERLEFMLVVLPLRAVGGTGSPVTPVALF
jgi:kynurenine formamidase